MQARGGPPHDSKSAGRLDAVGVTEMVARAGAMRTIDLPGAWLRIFGSPPRAWRNCADRKGQGRQWDDGDHRYLLR
jgi:hypothetical protein